MPDPLDEQRWQQPEIAQFYVDHGHLHGFQWSQAWMHENMIHRYLSESPFFEYTSKNGLPIDQSKSDPGAWTLTHNRRDFELWLAQRDGVEYMIVDGSTVDYSTTPPKNGIWVIRKQDRKRVVAQDEIDILGTYFLVRENMFQAPSVADIVGNRLLTATRALSEFFAQATDLSHWSPTAGYTYPAAQATRTAASPDQSRETSVAPGADAHSTRSASVQPTQRDVPDDRKVLLSIRNTMQYANEYADENPILGEPGHFTFTSSTAAVKKRKADEEATKARAAAKAIPAALKTEKPPPAILTEAKTQKADKKRIDKVKKRKSRANVNSPLTPVAPSSTASGSVL